MLAKWGGITRILIYTTQNIMQTQKYMISAYESVYEYDASKAYSQ